MPWLNMPVTNHIKNAHELCAYFLRYILLGLNDVLEQIDGFYNGKR